MRFEVDEYRIFVSHPETGDSSSYADRDLGACLQWALNWAGVEFKVESIGRVVRD